MTLETAPATTRSFREAAIFNGFPSGGEWTYRGAVTSKILRFDIAGETGVRPFFMTSIISREEKMAWQAFQDLLDYAVGMAQKEMAGLFGLDILSVDIQNGVKHFHAGDFGKLLVNHARNLAADCKTLIRYGQLFGLLHKRVPADWGKLEVKTFVEIIDPKKTRCDLYVRKLLRETSGFAPSLYAVQDMSLIPLWEVTETAGGMGPESATAEDPEKMSPEIYFLHPSLKTPRRFSGA